MCGGYEQCVCVLGMSIVYMYMYMYVWYDVHVHVCMRVAHRVYMCTHVHVKGRGMGDKNTILM